jgi:hypothetical protein
MDLQILTTIFCFISLVLGFTALNALSNLKRKVNAHLDRTDLHSEKLQTILSILQQIEAKQDLMFNNAPPVPGETAPSQEPLYEYKEYGIKVPARNIHKDSSGTHWVIEEAKRLQEQQEVLPSSLTYQKTFVPEGTTPIFLPQTKKKRKDAGVKRGPYKKATI